MTQFDLGKTLFPNCQQWQRRRKMRQLRYMVAGVVVIVAGAALLTLWLSGALSSLRLTGSSGAAPTRLLDTGK